MAKARVQYLCCECGGVQSTWMGKCPDCGAWDALEQYREPKQTKAAPVSGSMGELVAMWREGGDDGDGGGARAAGEAVPLLEVERADVERWRTGMREFDGVLGGGLVRGSVVLVGGDPGIGKSTLLLQVAAHIADDRRVLYTSSEESAYQTRLRAERLFDFDDGGSTSSDRASASQLDRLFILAETNLGRIVEQARKTRPDVLIIDSIQMIYRGDVDASPGSVTQLRRCCQDLVYLAKSTGMSVILVGHVTKQGQIAGPKLIEHLVDTVLSFEGDRHHAHRVVRAIKNRFGTTLDIALFEMTGAGLREAGDRSLVHEDGVSSRAGSVVCPAMHGSRCLLVEVQALTATGFLGNARRKTSGLDANRLNMLIAVLEKHGGLRLADQDVFVSTTGGLKVAEPGADLALTLAIAGAHYKRSLPAGMVAIGEVGLGGEVRRVAMFEQRLREAARLGYAHAVVPRGVSVSDGSGLRCHVVSDVGGAISMLDPVSRGLGGSGGG